MASFPYNKVLLIGATSGIGWELAQKLVQRGVFVVAVGRRQSRLDSFLAQHGDSKVATIAFDISEIDKAHLFAHKWVYSVISCRNRCFASYAELGDLSVVQQHPDLDCIILDAGVQYVMDFSKPHTVDMGNIQKEITTNYTSMVALTHAFVPFFQANSLNKEVAFM